MKKITLFFLLVLLHLSTWGQTYSVASIPDSLLTNADAVVRYEGTVFSQTDINNGTAKYTTVVTVINKDGAHHANLTIRQDKFMELKKFSGAVLHPETGKVIKKIGKNDLITTAYSEHISSDDKYSYYRHQSPSYPFTIKYEYEVRHKNGIPAYPAFAPMGRFGIAVEYAEHTLSLPANQKVRYKALRMDKSEPEIIKNGSTISYRWSLGNAKAIRSESYAPSLGSLIPIVIIAPEEFCMEGKCGDMTSWESLGIWHYSLLQGRDLIPADLKARLQEMTKDIEDEKEKIRHIFEYLQTTTRYVSIQLGIGGLQPLSAESVAKTGFGDCKALSNYMMAMLNAVDIPSTYVAISTDRPNLYTDFASLTQMNHVILMVPLSNDTLWLECTNPYYPFGYIHSSISGHQSLLIKESGSSICRVRKAEPVIQEVKTIHIKIDENGEAEASVFAIYRQRAYEYMLGFIHNMSREEQLNYLAKNLHMSKIKISDLEYTSAKSADPDIRLNFKLVAGNYANKSGNRLFVPLSPLDIGSVNLLKGGKRGLDIAITSTYSVADTLQIQVPDSYTVESIPQSSEIRSDFGEYSVEVVLEGQLLNVIQSFSYNPGTYPAEKAQEFQDFLKKIDKESKRKAVFRLKS